MSQQNLIIQKALARVLFFCKIATRFTNVLQTQSRRKRRVAQNRSTQQQKQSEMKKTIAAIRLADFRFALLAHNTLVHVAVAKLSFNHFVVYQHHKSAYADKQQHSRHKHDKHQNVRERIIDVAFGEYRPNKFGAIERIGIEVHFTHRASNYGKERVSKRIYRKRPYGFVIHLPVREREEPQYQHNRRYNHMKIHLNETAHCVVGIVPLKRRRKSHWNACGVNESRHKNIRGCHCADKRIVCDFFCTFNAERGKPRANEIHVHKHVRLNCEKRQNIEFSVIYGAEFFVIFEFVVAQSMYDNQKSEQTENHQQYSERLVFCEFAFLVHNAPYLFRNDAARHMVIRI